MAHDNYYGITITCDTTHLTIKYTTYLCTRLSFQFYTSQFPYRCTFQTLNTVLPLCIHYLIGSDDRHWESTLITLKVTTQATILRRYRPFFL